MLWFLCACTLPAFLIAYGSTFLIRRWAPAWGLIDQPAERKMHTTPTPLGGGIAIVIGVVLPLLLAQGTVALLVRAESVPAWMPSDVAVHLEGVLYRSGQLWGILAAGGVLLILGLLDDRFGVSWKWRLAVQFLLATALVAGGVRATLFITWPWLGMVVTVLWIVVLINALNFLDNMDGLCGGIALIASVIFALVMLTGLSEPRWLVGGCLLVLAGSVAGFLMHNWPPAKIFMGDAGSTFIGLLLGSMTVLGTFYEENGSRPHVILAPVCVLAIPLYDFSTVILIRLWRGQSPFQPDKNHFSHRLVELGLSRRDAVLTVHFATLTTGLGALLLYHVRDWTGAVLVIALIVCLLGIVSILEMAARSRAPNGTDGDRV